MIAIFRTTCMGNDGNNPFRVWMDDEYIEIGNNTPTVFKRPIIRKLKFSKEPMPLAQQIKYEEWAIIGWTKDDLGQRRNPIYERVKLLGRYTRHDP